MTSKLVKYPGISAFEAGYFYIPYIPMHYYKEPTPRERLQGRREYLTQCPSAPHTCTGYCRTEEFREEVERILRREFNLEDPDTPGYRRELDISRQKDCIEFVRADSWESFRF